METFNKTNTEITIEVITPEKAIYYLGRNIGNRGISKDRETFAQNDVIDVLRKRLQNKEYRTGDDKAKALCIAWNNYIQRQNRKQICVKNVETIEYL